MFCSNLQIQKKKIFLFGNESFKDFHQWKTGKSFQKKAFPSATQENVRKRKFEEEINE